jgi:hypothetical protein
MDGGVLSRKKERKKERKTDAISYLRGELPGAVRSSPPCWILATTRRRSAGVKATAASRDSRKVIKVLWLRGARGAIEGRRGAGKGRRGKAKCSTGEGHGGLAICRRRGSGCPCRLGPRVRDESARDIAVSRGSPFSSSTTTSTSTSTAS